MVERMKINQASNSPFKIIIDNQSQLLNMAKKKERTSLYASDYGGCHRKVFFQFYPSLYPVDFEVDPETARIFENGNDVHERLGRYLKAEERLNFVDEVNVPRDELDVHGRCDGIVTWQERMYVLEFKSINSRFVEAPKEQHEGQLTWYLHMFEGQRADLRREFLCGEFYPTEEQLRSVVSLKGRRFDELDPVEKRLLLSQGSVRGEIIYESKVNQSTFHFCLEYDPEVAEKVARWFAQAKKYVENGVLPENKYNKSSYPCRYGSKRCAYYDYCHKQD